VRIGDHRDEHWSRVVADAWKNGRVRRFNVLTGELDARQDRPGFSWQGARVGQKIGGAKIGATLYELADGEQTFPYHFHHGVEEWLYVVSGVPRLRVTDGERKLRPGDIVCFNSGPSGAHSVCGPGRIVLFSAQAAPSIAVYPDSDKIGSRPGGDDPDNLNFLRHDAVDYWDGE
jgi:uncharacterized cupin superfamily protein